VPHFELNPVVSRRNLLGLMGAGGISVVAAACGSSSPKSASVAPKSSGSAAFDPSKVNGTIDLARWPVGSTSTGTMAKIIAGFEAKYPGAKVTDTITASSEYQSTELTVLRNSSAGDIFTAFRGGQFQSFVDAGLYMDLSGQPFISNFQPKYLTSFASGGKQLGIPYLLLFLMFVYNESIFNQVGETVLPTTWDGFLSLCDKIKSKGIIPIAWPGGDANNRAQIMNAMVMNNAPTSNMFAEIQTGKLKATDAWFIKTLQQFVQLKPYFEPDSTGTAVGPCLELFASGKAAMLATGDYDISAARALGATFPMGVVSPVTVNSNPKYLGVYNLTYILGVKASTSEPDTALAFVDYLSLHGPAGTFANGEDDHVTVKNVDYTKRDLAATALWLNKPTILAPNYQFNSVEMGDAMIEAAIAAVNGTSPEAAAEAAQKTIDQLRAQAAA